MGKLPAWMRWSLALNVIGCIVVATLDGNQVARQQQPVDHALSGIVMILNLVISIVYYCRRNKPMDGLLTLDIGNQARDKHVVKS